VKALGQDVEQETADGGGDILDTVINMGRASSPVEAAIYVRRVLGLPMGRDCEETPAQAAARREKLAAARRENGRRQEEAGKAEAAERERLLAFARDLYASGKPATASIAEKYRRRSSAQARCHTWSQVRRSRLRSA
jgi:hypothetical protein